MSMRHASMNEGLIHGLDFIWKHDAAATLIVVYQMNTKMNDLEAIPSFLRCAPAKLNVHRLVMELQFLLLAVQYKTIVQRRYSINSKLSVNSLNLHISISDKTIVHWRQFGVKFVPIWNLLLALEKQWWLGCCIARTSAKYKPQNMIERRGRIIYIRRY